MPQDQVHSQPDDFVSPRALATYPILRRPVSQTLRELLRGSCVVPHGDLPLLQIVQALGEACLRRAGLTVLAKEVNVEFRRFLTRQC